MLNDIPSVDRAALQWKERYRFPMAAGVAHLVSLLGSEPVVLILALGWVLRSPPPRRPLAATLLLVCGGAEIVDSLLKALVRRPRPRPIHTRLPGQQYSFPSGHATASAAFYSYVAYRNWPQQEGGRRVRGSASILLFPLLVGLARVYLGTHYLTDVFGGYLLGVIWTGAVVLVRRLRGENREYPR